MAIYNNRKVDIISQQRITYKLPELIQVRDEQGVIWNVNSADLKFTDSELKSFQVESENPLDTFKKASDEDVESAKVGVAPVSDMIPDAKTKALQDKQEKMNQDNKDKAEAEATKTLEAETAPVKKLTK